MFGPFKQLSRPAAGPSVLAVALGVTAGAAAYLAWRRRFRRDDAEPLPADLAQIEEDAVAALSNDSRVGHRAIEVAAVSTGIIELTGDVENIEEAHHAVDVAQSVNGVHTVINRLTLVEPERHFAETRDRFNAGDPALTETHWEGIRVGMGQRRQSGVTDPERRDDHVKEVSRALEPDAPEAFAEPSARGEADTDGPSAYPDESYTGGEEERAV